MGGCDKTTPGAGDGRHVDEPAHHLPARRPDAARRLQGQYLGSGSDTWKYWDELRAGNITENDWQDVEDGIARSARSLHDDGHRVHDDQRVERWA
jgi:dihydroxy-acid dehydratase